MKTPIRLTFVLISVIAILTGCSTKSNNYELYNPSFNIADMDLALNKHMNDCEVQAYDNIPIPRNNGATSISTRNNSNAPDVNSILGGFESARNSPMAMYNQSIDNYKRACIRAKGWQLREKT